MFFCFFLFLEFESLIQIMLFFLWNERTNYSEDFGSTSLVWSHPFCL